MTSSYLALSDDFNMSQAYIPPERRGGEGGKKAPGVGPPLDQAGGGCHGGVNVLGSGRRNNKVVRRKVILVMPPGI